MPSYKLGWVGTLTLPYHLDAISDFGNRLTCRYDNSMAFPDREEVRDILELCARYPQITVHYIPHGLKWSGRRTPLQFMQYGILYSAVVRGVDILDLDPTLRLSDAMPILLRYYTKYFKKFEEVKNLRIMPAETRGGSNDFGAKLLRVNARELGWNQNPVLAAQRAELMEAFAMQWMECGI